jgi:hypothetical protein
MKELRPGSPGGTEVRILFISDPRRQTFLLVAGDKSRAWKKRYDESVPLAMKRYDEEVRPMTQNWKDVRKDVLRRRSAE